MARPGPEAGRDEATRVLGVGPERAFLPIGDGLNPESAQPHAPPINANAPNSARVADVIAASAAASEKDTHSPCSVHAVRNFVKLGLMSVEAAIESVGEDAPKQKRAEAQRPQRHQREQQ